MEWEVVLNRNRKRNSCGTEDVMAARTLNFMSFNETAISYSVIAVAMASGTVGVCYRRRGKVEGQCVYRAGHFPCSL